MKFPEGYANRALYALSLIDALAIFERWVIKELRLSSKPTMDRESFLELAKARSVRGRNANKKSDVRPLNTFLMPDGMPDTTEFSGRNYRTVQQPFCDFFSLTLSSHHLRHDSVLEQLRRDVSDEKSPARRLLTRIDELKDPAKLYECFQECQGEDRAESGFAVGKFLATTFQDTWKSLRHPEFPSLALFDAAAVLVESHELAVEPHQQGAQWGLFSFVREARGWTAKSPADVNTIVRDMLWLPPDFREEGSNLGFYASAVDRKCFRITDCSVEETTVIGLAQLGRDDKVRTQRIRFTFGEFFERKEFQLTHGLVTGTTGERGDPEFAAWKAVIVRPDWKDRTKLGTLLYLCKPSEGDRAFDILTDALTTCIVFSSALRREHPEAQERRNAFRALVANDTLDKAAIDRSFGQLLSFDFEQRLYTRLEVLSRDIEFLSFEREDMVGKVLDVLNEMIADSWNYVEPAQIIMFKSSAALDDLEAIEPNTNKPIKFLARLLIERENISPVDRFTSQNTLR